MLTTDCGYVARGLRGVGVVPAHDNHLGVVDHVAGRPGFSVPVRALPRFRIPLLLSARGRKDLRIVDRTDVDPVKRG
jgi:hypothetical protein